MRHVFPGNLSLLWTFGTTEVMTMYLDCIEEIIATRTLDFAGEETPGRKVQVHIGKPQVSKDSIGYYCPFQISGVGSEEVKYGKGIDGIQALQAALFLIAANLNYFNEQVGDKLRWEGSSESDFGFPGAR